MATVAEMEAVVSEVEHEPTAVEYVRLNPKDVRLSKVRPWSPCKCDNCARHDSEADILGFADWGLSVACRLHRTYFPRTYLCAEYLAGAW